MKKDSKKNNKKKNNDKEKFLTTEEVAGYLKVSQATIWRYIRQGKFKATKLTRSTYRVSEDELRKFLKKQSK